MSVPPFHGNISFHAQHSPMGAFFSFTCGHFGSRGGFGLQIGRPGNQNLYIGVKDGDRKSDAPLECLPFFEGADADEAARFDVEKKAETKKPGITSYRREEIQRHYGWATDRWVTPDFEFAIYSASGPLPDPSKQPRDFWAHKEPLLPAVFADLRVDNTKGTRPKTAVFAMKFAEAGVRLIDEGLSNHVGFAWRDRYGVGASVRCNYSGGEPPKEARAATMLRWSVEDGVANPQPVHRLGNTPGVVLEVPPGQDLTLTLVLAVYASEVATTRLDGRYAYTRLYANLNDVLNTANRIRNDYLDWCEKIDRELIESKVSPDQQFLIAHATRSYYGSTQLLDVGGQPFWVVNEGEYCMMNTLDLSVDQVFWELKQNPWVVRNLLDNFVRHYSYVDRHGLSFCHDMGVHNQFSPFGHSSYELPNLTGCFSYMTQEELCNWILVAACYVAKTKDLAWLRQNAHVISACSASMQARMLDGTMGLDSDRCGSGQEITTYDSLDESLGQARQNLYIAVKCWAAFLGLIMLDKQLGGKDEYDMVNAERNASLAAGPLKDGFIPAVFEADNPGFKSRILPAIEGLLYPWYWQHCGIDLAVTNDLYREPRCVTGGPLDPEGPFKDMLAALRQHTLTLLKDPERRNLFPDGGIKLSSTSNNSWMSKIAIFQHVCRKVFKLDEDPEIREIFRKADAAHVKWMTEGDSAYWACSDQFVSGVAKGSKYYPRIITTALWMD